jgi:UDPglucose 6-dehydrogenase
MKVGCIGQGFVGKNFSDDLENRGIQVTRYSLEPDYINNKNKLQECDVIFIAVPTPSTVKGFDYSVVDEVINYTSSGSIVVVRSTMLPGTTQKLQDKHEDRIILFYPEFLSEVTAAQDTSNPIFNIIGLPNYKEDNLFAAEKVKTLLPKSNNNYIVDSTTAELFKYIHNIHGYTRIIITNIFYDMANELGLDWSGIKQKMDVDPMMSEYYNLPVHKAGRGAGGNCFIKDMAAFKSFHKSILPNDNSGHKVLTSLEDKNLELLTDSKKDLNLLEGVYGEDIVRNMISNSDK